MRLTCSACSARYDVADDMIPPGGRDVQCSNCGTAWFQPGAEPRPGDAFAGHGATPGPHAPVARAEGNPAHPAPQLDGPAKANPKDTGTAPLIKSGGTTARHDLPPAVRAILKEEAQREHQLRRVEAVDAQEDTTTTGPAARLGDIDKMIQDRRGAGGRRDMSPDIDTMSPALRGASDPVVGRKTLTAPPRRRGRRIGFGLVLLCSVAAVVIYTQAAQITQRYPQVGPTLEHYVQGVDGARVWLQDVAQGIITRGQDALDRN
ncbi:MAG: zinc-ribbon domain-containing protein [Rhodobacteraceae bacterium]|nr:zinc-ribbon domain-containing protein [Paracoccaceae bacterium]